MASGGPSLTVSTSSLIFGTSRWMKAEAGEIPSCAAQQGMLILKAERVGDVGGVLSL
jgi:hypothetical protein